MSARHKINSMFVLGAVVVAGIAGFQTQSWGVFMVLAGILICCAVGFGGIRVVK